MFSLDLKSGPLKTLWQSCVISLGIVALLVLVRFARGPINVARPAGSQQAIAPNTGIDDALSSEHASIQAVDGTSEIIPSQNPIISIPNTQLSPELEVADTEPELFLSSDSNDQTLDDRATRQNLRQQDTVADEEPLSLWSADVAEGDQPEKGAVKKLATDHGGFQTNPFFNDEITNKDSNFPAEREPAVEVDIANDNLIEHEQQSIPNPYVKSDKNDAPGSGQTNSLDFVAPVQGRSKFESDYPEISNGAGARPEANSWDSAKRSNQGIPRRDSTSPEDSSQFKAATNQQRYDLGPSNDFETGSNRVADRRHASGDSEGRSPGQVSKAASSNASNDNEQKTSGNEKDRSPFQLASAKKQGGPSGTTQGTTDYVMAGQPKMGDHFKDDRPVTDKRAWLVPTPEFDFSADAIDPTMPYDPGEQQNVYEGKTLNANQRPLVEIGRPWYQLGQLSEGYTFFGKHNPITPQFIVHGDFRTAVASNTQNGDNVSQWAFQWNMNLDLRLTSTERFVSFINPLGAGNNTRFLFDNNEFEEEFDADLDFGYFEGDLGAIVGGMVGETLPFDFPFAIGFMPLLVQNGVWFEDAVLGVAMTIPARNSPLLHISNMDWTFFAAYDEIDSDAFPGDDDVAKMYGVLGFVEAMNGYFEIDYAFIEDRNRFLDRSYHNIGIGFTRRYGRFLSNSVRVIANAGQDSDNGANTADGVVLLLENSIITAHPSTLVPYFNFFAGFDRPQSAARAGAAGGILRNTGILFESDNLTGYPTLDATANETAGAALGINMMAADFSQQLVLEVAALGVLNGGVDQNARGDQYGIGFRHQLPLSNSVILRTDGMMGFFRGDEDVNGLRVELRHKY